MDLLGSILGTMTGPPKGNEKEREERRKAKEMNKKLEEKRSEQAKVFRQKIEGKIDAFVKISVTLDRDKPTEDGSIRDHKIEFDNRCIHLEPMNQYERSVVHDTAEIAGLVAHSFGQEDIDRHVVIWKKEFTPCEDEINALKQGKEWDPIKNAKEKEELKLQEELDAHEAQMYEKTKKQKFVPRNNYQQKYEHLIGSEEEFKVAKKAEANSDRSFGMVSAESKKDRRTVEQVQAEIRAKKRAQASSLADESLSTDAEAHEEAQFLTAMENKRFKGAQDTL